MNRQSKKNAREVVLATARAEMLRLGADFFDMLGPNPASEQARAARSYFLDLPPDARAIIETAATAEAALS